MEMLKNFGLVLISIGGAVCFFGILWLIGFSLDGHPQKANIVLGGGVMLLLILSTFGLFFKHQAEKKDRRW